MLNLAKKYRDMGFSVFPVVPETKRPAVEWGEFQKRIATEDEVEKWWTENPNHNIGIACGEVSGITVVDFDNKNNGLETLKSLKMPPTVVVKTGGGGWHYYYKHVPNSKNSAGVLPGVDIRTDGGYVVAPGSLHSSGNRYEEVTEFDKEMIVDFPTDVIPLEMHGEQNSNTPEKWKDIFENGAQSGSRNNTAAKVAGFLLKRIERKNWKTAWVLYEMWCKYKLKPQIPEDEYKRTFISIANAEQERLSENDWLKKVENNPDKVKDFIKSYTQVIPK